MQVKKRLGEMLVENRLITEDRLKQALIEQKKAGLKLGQYLTRLGIVSEPQIIDLLSFQLKMANIIPTPIPSIWIWCG